MAKQTIGEFLATLRKAGGYTQQQVADRLGVSNRTVSVWETGKAFPDILTLPAIAELYGVTVDEILAGERSKIKDTTGAIGELSHKSQSSLYKNVLARSAVKNSVLTGAGIGCALFPPLLLLVGDGLPVTALVILFLLVVAGVVAVAVLFAVFDKSALAAAGIWLSDGLSSEQARTVYKLRNAELRSVRIIGICWLISGGVSFAICALLYSFVMTDLGTTIFIVTFLCGGAFLLVAACLQSAEIYARGEEKTVAARKFNVKLWRKCALSVLLASVVAFTACFPFFHYGQYRVAEEYTGSRGELAEYLHTVLLPDNLAQTYGSDEYFVDIFSITDHAFVPGEVYSLGEDFYCRPDSGGCTLLYDYDEAWPEFAVAVAERLAVYSGENDTAVILENEYFYDFRSADMTVSNTETIGFLSSFQVSIYGENYCIVIKDGVYVLRWGAWFDYSDLVFSVFIVSIVVFFAIGTGIYLAKRKKYLL